jgi:aminoglycoside phosphotransferase (APT) family kinase protein
MTATTTTQERLRELLAATYDDRTVLVEQMDPMTGGANSETWLLRVSSAEPDRQLVLRRPKGDNKTRFATEAAALRGASAKGVPVPTVVAHDDDDAALGSPYLITEFVQGETLARRILRDPAYDEVRPRLAAQCGDILARIHQIPVADVPGLAPVDSLQLLRRSLDAYEDPLPVLELGYRRLEQEPPEPRTEVVVHGDFRNGNLIVGTEGVRAVLDWEEVHVGDGLKDLGWLCARVWRFGGAGPVGGFGRREDLFAGYEAAGGGAVDPDAVRWWELWAAVRWGVGCLEMASRHLDGSRRSVEFAAIGRRAWEQEYDVAMLLHESKEG